MSSQPTQRRSASEYQHYIPQFILRKWSDYRTPVFDGNIDKKIAKKARSRAQARAQANCLILDARQGEPQLRELKVKDIFGLKNMYCNLDAATGDEQEVEKQLSSLEKDAAYILNRIEQDRADSKLETRLGRPDKDVLRKFLFIMLYRNKNFHRRYDQPARDRNLYEEELLKYMQIKGFQSRKQVWFANIRAIINMQFNPDPWLLKAQLEKECDPECATWCFKHLTDTFLSFCTPESPEDEFILTENCYGVFEGPSDAKSWIGWHQFSPLSPRLIIVMRHKLLHGLQEAWPASLRFSWDVQRNCLVDVIKSRFDDKEKAASWLQDLPISRPSSSRDTYDVYKSRPLTLSEADTFNFKFFRISNKHAQRINCVFLEEALYTDRILFKSQNAFVRALESYLKEDKPGFKNVVIRLEHNRSSADQDTWPETRREGYLRALERVIANLGSTVKAKYTVAEPNIIEIFTHSDLRFLEGWTKLGGKVAELPKSLAEDFEQAYRIVTLRTRTDALAVKKKLSACSREAMAQVRRDFINSLTPRRVWMHHLLFRGMERIGPDEYERRKNEWSRLLVQEASSGGHETVLLDAYTIFRHPMDFTRTLTCLFNIEGYLQRQHGTKLSCEEGLNLAIEVPGTVDRCGIPKLERRASELLYRGHSPDLVRATLSKNLHCPDIEQILLQELCIRTKLKNEFHDLFKGEMEKATLMGLREVLFERIWRTEIPIRAS